MGHAEHYILADFARSALYLLEADEKKWHHSSVTDQDQSHQGDRWQD